MRRRLRPCPDRRRHDERLDARLGRHARVVRTRRSCSRRNATTAGLTPPSRFGNEVVARGCSVCAPITPPRWTTSSCPRTTGDSRRGGLLGCPHPQARARVGSCGDRGARADVRPACLLGVAEADPRTRPCASSATRTSGAERARRPLRPTAHRYTAGSTARVRLARLQAPGVSESREARGHAQGAHDLHNER
jgi:hypothetical protein